MFQSLWNLFENSHLVTSFFLLNTRLEKLSTRVWKTYWARQSNEFNSCKLRCRHVAASWLENLENLWLSLVLIFTLPEISSRVSLCGYIRGGWHCIHRRSVRIYQHISPYRHEHRNAHQKWSRHVKQSAWNSWGKISFNDICKALHPTNSVHRQVRSCPVLRRVHV